MPDIDFVVLWVDSTDTEWKKQKNYWQNNKIELHPDDVRYRDWGLFKYWFRCVEQNAPWVRKVHLVTNGQCPKWLNLNNSKLQLDIHESFMDKISVPTFSSHPIELQLHKIKDLAEHFAYFNNSNQDIGPKCSRERSAFGQVFHIMMLGGFTVEITVMSPPDLRGLDRKQIAEVLHKIISDKYMELKDKK